MKRLLMVLTFCQMIAYSGLCGMRLSGDTLTPIVPKGYVLLSYEGARNALRAKVDADFCKKKIAVMDSMLEVKDIRIVLGELSEKNLSDALLIERKNSSVLKRKLFWRTLELVGVSAITLYIILK